MKDTIFDIVQYTASPGFFDLAKITGTTESTEIWASDEKRNVVLEATLKNPAAPLIGEIGLGNLTVLNGIAGLYKRAEESESSKVKIEVTTVTKNGETAPDYFIFEDQDGNHDKYRLMNKNIINDILEQSKFKGVNWEITLDKKNLKPSKISEFTAKSSVYAGIEPTFTMKTENNELVFIFGSDETGSHFGRMTFATNVTGDIKEGFGWPIDKFLSLIKLGMAAPKCTLNFCQIACMITIESDIGIYNYILPGHSR
jgi:hypothetical protein